MGILLLIGSPGSGKGTLVQQLRAQGFASLAMGDILRRERRAQSALGKQLAPYLDNGILIPDDLAFQLFQANLPEREPLVVEGFPSTLAQYRLCLPLLQNKNAAFLQLLCPEEIAIERITARLLCSECAAIYHETSAPPKEPKKCDICHGALLKRAEDNEACAKKRIAAYNQKTLPIAKYAKEIFPFHTIESSTHYDISDIPISYDTNFYQSSSGLGD